MLENTKLLPPAQKSYWNNDDECCYYTYGEYRIKFWQKDGIPKYSVEQVRKDYQAGKKLKYCMFWKPQPDTDTRVDKGCLSQWQSSSFFSDNGSYCCMEQFMMAQKAELFGDSDILKQILSCKDPKKIKALGQKVKHFDESVWSKTKYAIVLNGNYMKFSQNPQMKKFLLQTSDKILVEASPYDGIWGIKMDEANKDAQNPLKWRGQNLLGFALMEVRDVLRQTIKN
ncbi:MAG: NADAR family protein, partial [Lachnospiraceae bacterium]|nr:NADAR family protein [Lachnospiraceae bacterium]